MYQQPTVGFGLCLGFIASSSSSNSWCQAVSVRVHTVNSYDEVQYVPGSMPGLPGGKK